MFVMKTVLYLRFFVVCKVMIVILLFVLLLSLLAVVYSVIFVK